MSTEIYLAVTKLVLKTDSEEKQVCLRQQNVLCAGQQMYSPWATNVLWASQDAPN